MRSFLLLLLIGASSAAPARPLPDKSTIAPTRNSDPRRIVVKFLDDSSVAVEGASLRIEDAAARAVLPKYAAAQWRHSHHRVSPEKLQSMRAIAARHHRRAMPDMRMYFDVLLPEGMPLEEALRDFNALAIVEAAWPAPRPLPPPLHLGATPDLTGFQNYDNPPPNGIGSTAATATYGVAGEGVAVCDVEYTFNDAHEDLAGVTYLGNPSPTDPGYGPDHGTAVLGVIGAQSNGFGMTGTIPSATRHFSGSYDGISWDVGAAVLAAAASMEAGDVFIIEQQIDGPNWPGGSSQVGLIPTEWYRPWYDAFVTVTGNGMIVVQAAGNGSHNLDDPIYSTGNGGHHPFRQENDSGAIIVGAGSSSTRNRLSFSNYGQTVDVQGWGQNVATTGYGDLFGDSDNNLYTASFSGTSSASPIVASAVVLIQSVRKARGMAPLSAPEMNQLLKATGTPQGAATAAQRIGPLPNIPAAAEQTLATPAGDRWEIH